MLARWVIVLAAGVALAAACDKDEPGLEPPPRERPTGRSQLDELAKLVGDASIGDADASAGTGAVGEIRRTQLELTPRRTPSEHLVFARGRLAQLGPDALVVRDAKSFGELVRVPISSPRRVVELADGSLLAVGSDGLVRIDKREQKPALFPRIPLFPESLVLGDRRDEHRVWVLHAIGSLLYQYAVGGDGGGVQTLDFLDLEGFDQRAFCALKDGSFLYTAGEKLRRFFHGGKRWDLRLPEGGDVWRLLTTRRIDQVWLARSKGRLELVQISADGVRVVRAIELEDVFDVASNDHEIAAIHVTNEPGKPRRWTLGVYDPQGKRRFLHELPAEPKVSVSDDWVQIATRDKSLALSSHASLVAVGGPSWVSVWNTRSGARLYAP